MKILIVDDEREFVEFLKDRVVGKGHSAETAYDGESALELIKANNYDLVFLDHNMPGLTGLELTKYIKGNDLKPKTVMITGYEEIDGFFMEKMGVDEYLTKPVKIENIDNILDKYSKL